MFRRNLELSLFRNRLELRDPRSEETRSHIAEPAFSTESAIVADDDCLIDALGQLVRDMYQTKSLFMHPSVTVVSTETPLTKVEQKAVLRALHDAGFAKADFAEGAR